MTLIKELIENIKKKKELSGIDDSVVREHINEYLAKNKLILENLNSSQLKLVLKDIRAGLRNQVGRFQASTKDRAKLLEKDDLPALLKTHSSTKERINFYPQLREIIKKLKVTSILDLGCGLNPLALAEPGVKYYASDINLEDLNIVASFFKKKNLDGTASVCDLNKIESCCLPETDLCLVLKVFDILGKKDYETAKRIIEKISSKHLIASFSTRTLSGKPMNSPRRIWFEKLLKSLCYEFEIVKSDNELFYII
jgi:hypothetical protein